MRKLSWKWKEPAQLSLSSVQRLGHFQACGSRRHCSVKRAHVCPHACPHCHGRSLVACPIARRLSHVAWQSHRMSTCSRITCHTSPWHVACVLFIYIKFCADGLQFKRMHRAHKHIDRLRYRRIYLWYTSSMMWHAHAAVHVLHDA